jgi:hypothetical protein
MMAYDVTMAEVDCEHSSSDEIDSLVRMVAGGTCQGGCLMVVLCSPKKAILYMRVKPRRTQAGTGDGEEGGGGADLGEAC